MKLPLVLLLSLSIIAIFPACKKSDHPDHIEVYTPEYITTTISGRVTDNGKLPVSGAVVKAGSISVTTGSNGSFVLRDVTIDKKAAFVKAEKNGFFLGTRTFVANTDETNEVAIQLIPKTSAGTINSTAGGSVSVPGNGGSISFQPNSIVLEGSSSPYSGQVEISAFYFDPEAPEFNNIMPGTLRGITADNRETGLQSFGMMAVELTGAGGEKLQLAAGKAATMHFTIPKSLQGEAPATIPLWSLDETTGLWKEEGKAMRNGQEYIGTVAHFSFWNCDAPFQLVDFSGTIQDKLGNNINGVEVVLDMPVGTSTTGSLSGNGFTDGEGRIHGKLPANRILQLKIYNKCKTVLHTQQIGPFSSTADLAAIKIDHVNAQVTISGTVKNCENGPVSNGFVSIKLEDIYYNVPFTNGSFTTTITRCNNNETTAVLTAYDLTGQTSGEAVQLTVTGSTATAGTLMACGIDANMFMNYTIDGVTWQLSPPDDILVVHTSTNFLAVTGTQKGSNRENIVVIFRETHQTGQRVLYNSDILFGDPQAYYSRVPGNAFINITEAGDAAGFIAGNFTGTLRDSLNTRTVPVSCSFRVKR